MAPCASACGLESELPHRDPKLVPYELERDILAMQGVHLSSETVARLGQIRAILCGVLVPLGGGARLGEVLPSLTVLRPPLQGELLLPVMAGAIIGVRSAMPLRVFCGKVRRVAMIW